MHSSLALSAGSIARGRCGPCASINLSKREQSAACQGMVALVTGGRVRIGFQICLKLLRAGARVLVTSRYPCDAAARYAAETDYDEWASLLHIFGPFELADVHQLESDRTRRIQSRT